MKFDFNIDFTDLYILPSINIDFKLKWVFIAFLGFSLFIYPDGLYPAHDEEYEEEKICTL